MSPTRTALAAALAAATALAAASLAAAPLHAQNGRVATSGSRVPAGHMPPAGLCRVWYDGVPPGRQPAPMNCDAAERLAARGGRGASVIYGPGARRGDGRWDDRRDDRRDGRYDDRYDPRYPNGRYEPGRNRAGERPDPRRDGRWDDRRDRDGRWDDRGDRRMPMMPTVAVLRRGSASDIEWLGRGDYRARWSDANRDGRPEQVWWTDARGTVVQQWSDVNRDGRVDRVTYYQNGRPVRTVD